MFHTRERFTYKGHVVCIGVDVERYSSHRTGKATPTFIKTPAVYIDHIKIVLEASAALREDALDAAARKFIDAMPQPPAPKRRFRSMPAYLREQGKCAGLNVIGMGLLVASAIMGMIGFLGAIILLIAVATHSEMTADVVFVVLALIGGACFAGMLCTRSFKHAQRIDPGVPLTRANTADLPAPNSLVRASTEPMQAQEAVLLRAAAEGVETPPEQLVRAVNGQE